MIKKKSNSFLSCDRKTSVNVVIWCPDETEYARACCGIADMSWYD